MILLRQLESIVLNSPHFMAMLMAVQEVGPPSSYIGAGAIRNLVWDRLHAYTAPSALSDVDVAYFDRLEAPAMEQSWQQRLGERCALVPWEVTNQAHVHLWFHEAFGHRVEPLTSLEEAVASWPEYASAVAVRLTTDGRVEVIAPHGLDDLFNMVVRRNPCRVSKETYRLRVEEKRYIDRWPQATIHNP